MKKYFVFLVVTLLLLTSTQTFGSYKGNELVRIGLNHGNKNASVISITSDDGLALFASVDRQAIKIFDCESKSASLNKGVSTKANVVYDQRFSTFSELYSAVGNLRKSNATAFYYYDKGWYLALGRYDSSTVAKGKLNSFSGVKASNLKIKETKSDDVYLLVNDKIQLAYSSEGADFFVAAATYPDRSVVTYAGKTYRGGIGANRSVLNDMAVINYLLMDHYIYGILPEEMSGNWPSEALKAQAVVARNFALSSFNKHADEGYDLCNTTDCQVYGGHSVEALGSNLAVDETTGDLLYYNDELVVGFYHSNSGGRTASIENIWTSSIPYLVSVDDPFSVGAPNTDWTVELSPSEIESKLSEKNYFIGSLKDVQVTAVALDGRVQQIKFIGTKGTATLKKEEMRKVFGYKAFKSIWFEVLTDNTMAVSDGSTTQDVNVSRGAARTSTSIVEIPASNTITIIGATGTRTAEISSSVYTFAGHGFGHGIGMSQYGAKKMAEEGYTYDEILYHYYSGTHIVNN